MMDGEERFRRGIEEFNDRRFYDCHDTLEALWMDSVEPRKTFYQGILQIAVACYHLDNHNWRGAVILLGEGIRRLHPYGDEYGGVDVGRLVEESAGLLKFLQGVAPDRLAGIVENYRLTSSPYTLPTIIESKD